MLSWSSCATPSIHLVSSCLPLMCFAKCHQSSRPFSPPSLTRIQARQFAVAHPPTHDAYRFPPLSGSQPPVSEMTFPASLCCPTDVLSETNQATTKKKKTQWKCERGTCESVSTPVRETLTRVNSSHSSWTFDRIPLLNSFMLQNALKCVIFFNWDLSPLVQGLITSHLAIGQSLAWEASLIEL